MAEKKIPVTIKAGKEDSKTTDSLLAYLVDNEGTLIESVPFKGGTAQFKTDAGAIHGKTKIYIAAPPPAEAGKIEVTEKLLLKIGAWKPTSRIGVGNVITLPTLPPIISPIPFKWCHIKGSLTKSFIIDGVSKVLPVCNARVHICDVDPIRIIWPQIPDKVITDLWWRLKDIVRKPIPIPIPDPPPIIRPRPELDTSLFINKRIDAKAPISIRRSEIISQQAVLPVLPANIQNVILSNSISSFSEVLKNNFNLFHPYLCLWPWYWPWFYKCDPIATVITDCNGKFDYRMLQWLLGDHPDIYIWVEVLVDGQWVTVYNPRVACNTRWNYSCGTDINIRLTDPRIKPCECDPLVGSIVWMKNVNSGVSIRNIQQNTNPSGHLANAIGLTSFATVDKVSPFGNSFPFVVQFGSGFPNSSVTHYRWKYRKLKDAYLQNDLGSTVSIEGDVSKAYTYEIDPGGPNNNFATGSFLLGPTYNGGKPKYKIPHSEASIDVPSQPTAEWNQDTASINVSTLNFANGLYEFIFELLDNNGAVVPLTSNPFVVTRKSTDLPPPTPETSTINAEGLAENYLIKNIAGQTIGFRFVMRIDNLKCYADVLDALVDGNTTDTECGFGHYNNKATDVATLRFLAGHEHDFATYSFGVTKGNSNPVGDANSSGYVSVGNNGYAITPTIVSGITKDRFQKNIPLTSMLGSCTMAAFAQNLYVRATHTNGNVILHEYDASDTAAIAIAPK